MPALHDGNGRTNVRLPCGWRETGILLGVLQRVAKKLDKWGAVLATVFGTAALALYPLWGRILRAFEWHWWVDVALVVALAVLSAGGGIAAAREKKRIEDARAKERAMYRAEVMTGIRGTLVPVAERLIKIAPDLTDEEFTNSMTDLAARCTTFVKSGDDDMPDTNVYLFESRNSLVRVNDAAGSARARFTKSRKRDPGSLEESAVVDRVKARDKAICADVESPEDQAKLALNPGPRTYRAFISVPIVVDGAARGMISLNSKRIDRLTEVHEVFLEQMAQLVASIDAVKRAEKRS